MKKLMTFAFTAIAAVAFTSASAQTNIHPVTGTGFLSKGDVQYTLGWNNNQLQNNAASMVVTYSSTVVTEVSWECQNSRNENIQERARTTTTTISGVVSAVARVKNQITGFNLMGFSSSSSSSTTEGNLLNSCPTNWVLITPAGEPVVVSTEGGILVNGTPLVSAPIL